MDQQGLHGTEMNCAINYHKGIKARLHQPQKHSPSEYLETDASHVEVIEERGVRGYDKRDGRCMIPPGLGKYEKIVCSQNRPSM